MLEHQRPTAVTWAGPMWYTTDKVASRTAAWRSWGSDRGDDAAFIMTKLYNTVILSPSISQSLTETMLLMVIFSFLGSVVGSD